MEHRRVEKDTLEAGASVTGCAEVRRQCEPNLSVGALLSRCKLEAAVQNAMKLLPVSVAENEEPPKSKPVEVVDRASGESSRTAR